MGKTQRFLFSILKLNTVIKDCKGTTRDAILDRRTHEWIMNNPWSKM